MEEIKIINYKIGDTLTLDDGTVLKVMHGSACAKGCFFWNRNKKECQKYKYGIHCFCTAFNRPDRKDIVFVKFGNDKSN